MVHLTSKLVKARTKHEPVEAPLEALISPLHHHGCSVVLRNLLLYEASRAPPQKESSPERGLIACGCELKVLIPEHTASVNTSDTC
jgi:hypothetical protein